MLNERKVAGVILGLAAAAVLYLYILPMIYGVAIIAGWIGR